jgi:hypothetical protein
MSEETTQGAPAPQLQLGDILTATQAIQLASSRGAFKIDEYAQIGTVYNRLVSFLQASGAITQAQAPTQPAAEAPVENQ